MALREISDDEFFGTKPKPKLREISDEEFFANPDTTPAPVASAPTSTEPQAAPVAQAEPVQPARSFGGALVENIGQGVMGAVGYGIPSIMNTLGSAYNQTQADMLAARMAKTQDPAERESLRQQISALDESSMRQAESVPALQQEHGQLAQEEEARQIAEGRSGAAQTALRGARMGAESLTTAVPGLLAGGLGGSATTAFLAGGIPGATDVATRAFGEAQQAGLKDDEAMRYAATQGAIELGVSGAFNAIPALRGLESAALRTFKQPASDIAKTGIKEGVKQLVKDTGAEITEENLTEISQAVSSKLQGVDPTALTQENLLRTVIDTTVATGMTMGLAGSPSLIKSALPTTGQPATPTPPIEAPTPIQQQADAALQASTAPLQENVPTATPEAMAAPLGYAPGFMSVQSGQTPEGAAPLRNMSLGRRTQPTGEPPNAIQEQSTAGVPIQPEAGNSQGVSGTYPQGQEAANTGQAQASQTQGVIPRNSLGLRTDIPSRNPDPLKSSVEDIDNFIKNETDRTAQKIIEAMTPFFGEERAKQIGAMSDAQLERLKLTPDQDQALEDAVMADSQADLDASQKALFYKDVIPYAKNIQGADSIDTIMEELRFANSDSKLFTKPDTDANLFLMRSAIQRVNDIGLSSNDLMDKVKREFIRTYNAGKPLSGDAAEMYESFVRKLRGVANKQPKQNTSQLSPPAPGVSPTPSVVAQTQKQNTPDDSLSARSEGAGGDLTTAIQEEIAKPLPTSTVTPSKPFLEPAATAAPTAQPEPARPVSRIVKRVAKTTGADPVEVHQAVNTQIDQGKAEIDNQGNVTPREPYGQALPTDENNPEWASSMKIDLQKDAQDLDIDIMDGVTRTDTLRYYGDAHNAGKMESAVKTAHELNDRRKSGDMDFQPSELDVAGMQAKHVELKKQIREMDKQTQETGQKPEGYDDVVADYAALTTGLRQTSNSVGRMLRFFRTEFNIMEDNIHGILATARMRMGRELTSIEEKDLRKTKQEYEDAKTKELELEAQRKIEQANSLISSQKKRKGREKTFTALSKEDAIERLKKLGHCGVS